MAIIDPDGLFGGDRLRRCSNMAQLHWPRLFLASDGYGRLEINYARIVGRAYATFNPIPSEADVTGWLQEYAKNYLVFLYAVDGQLWGQWDTRLELLPRYKTATDRRSPVPPENEFREWKRKYREETKAFPKCFGNISESFLYGVGGGVGVGGGDGSNTCTSGDALLDDSLLNSSGGSTPEDGCETVQAAREERRRLNAQQDAWFEEWWAAYWLKKSRKRARAAFGKYVRTEARFREVMAATRAQNPEMQRREPQHRPHGETWLNGERWNDEDTSSAPLPKGTMDPDTARRIQEKRRQTGSGFLL